MSLTCVQLQEEYGVLLGQDPYAAAPSACGGGAK